MRIAAVLLALLVAVPLFAADAKIENLQATAAHDKVTVSFSLSGVFTNGEIAQTLQSGAPTSFSYSVEIFRDRPNWFDEDVGRATLDVICTFNSVTREYLLNYRRDRKLVRSQTFTDLHALERAMTEIAEPDLFEIGGRKPYKLKVRVRADLMRGWVFWVVPWEFSTRWREARVKAVEIR